MAEKSNVIDIDADLCQELERLHYEYNSYMNVEKSFLDDHRLDPDASAIESPIFDSYHKKTIAALQVYDEKKNELTKRYDLENKNWQLDFKTKQVTVS